MISSIQSAEMLLSDVDSDRDSGEPLLVSGVAGSSSDEPAWLTGAGPVAKSSSSVSVSISRDLRLPSYRQSTQSTKSSAIPFQ